MVKTSGTDVSDFADITHETWDGGGIYRAINKETGEEMGHLRYLILHDGNVIRTTEHFIEPQWRGRGIGTVFGDTLHSDYPDHMLDVGSREDFPNPQWWDHMRQQYPDFDTTVVNARQGR